MPLFVDSTLTCIAFHRVALYRVALVTSWRLNQIGLLAKIFHEMPDGELGVSWCGDFDYSKEQGEFFAACGEFPYDPDSDIAIRCLDNGTQRVYTQQQQQSNAAVQCSSSSSSI